MSKLWGKNQLLVIISRVKKLENLTFIGPKSLSLQTKKSISFDTKQWDSFIDDFIENLAARTDATSVVQFPISQNIYPICRQVMPEDTCPSVFCFYSLKNCTVHVGCCMNVKKKLQDMNGFCEDVPPSILMGKPWALLCAAFEPAANAKNDSILVMESKWSTVLRNCDNMQPSEIAEILKKETYKHTGFFDTFNFETFIDNSS